MGTTLVLLSTLNLTPGQADLSLTHVRSTYGMLGPERRNDTLYSGHLPFSSWGWTLFSGIISLALGILIWRNLPEAAFWVHGTFVGIDLIFIGWSWGMLGLAV